MFGKKKKREEEPSFADELRRNSAEAPARKRREEVEKETKRRQQWAENLYQECRARAKEESDAGKHEACVGTGLTPGYVSAEDDQMLEGVMDKLRTEDKLRVKLGKTTTKHTSDDTGEDFTRDHVVFILTW